MKTILRLATFALALSLVQRSFAQHYVQTNLVSNTPGNASVTDSQLINAWGLARASNSAWWVSDAGAGVTTIYNGAGEKQSLVVTIPSANPKKTQASIPTGMISNQNQSDFLLAAGAPAMFLFVTADGTIAGWNSNVALTRGAALPSTNAVTMVKTSDGSGFTGITSAFIDGQRFLYVANFTKGRVDVFDSAFQRVKLPRQQANKGKLPFVDENLPANYVPFNVQAIGDDIVVTYAFHPDSSAFETDGPGLGRVDIFDSSGTLLKRLEHGDWLNAPWGVALAPLDFGRFSHDLLIGQFAGGGDTQSSGFIAAYHLFTGKLDGLLQDSTGKSLSINGIWAISPGNISPANSDPDAAPAAQIYFTAGPNHGTNGLFGYITATPSELIEGNAQ